MMMMKLEEPAWRWEGLPSPDELMPLSQSLITPDLALAFDIPTPTTSSNPPPQPTHTHLEFDPPAPSSDDQARTLKRPRLVWTPQLHKRFVDAVAHLGIKNAVPKTIMQLMSVDGLTRENVASHLQKYRLYLKRMQGLSSSSSPASHADDHLFATVPHPFLNRPGPPFLQVGHVHHPHHHQHQQQYYHPQQRHVGGGFLVAGVLPPPPAVVEEAEKKVLTLFPTNEM